MNHLSSTPSPRADCKPKVGKETPPPQRPRRKSQESDAVRRLKNQESENALSGQKAKPTLKEKAWRTIAKESESGSSIDDGSRLQQSALNNDRTKAQGQGAFDNDYSHRDGVGEEPVDSINTKSAAEPPKYTAETIQEYNYSENEGSEAESSDDDYGKTGDEQTEKARPPKSTNDYYSEANLATSGGNNVIYVGAKAGEYKLPDYIIQALKKGGERKLIEHYIQMGDTHARAENGKSLYSLAVEFGQDEIAGRLAKKGLKTKVIKDIEFYQNNIVNNEDKKSLKANFAEALRNKNYEAVDLFIASDVFTKVAITKSDFCCAEFKRFFSSINKLTNIEARARFRRILYSIPVQHRDEIIKSIREQRKRFGHPKYDYLNEYFDQDCFVDADVIDKLKNHKCIDSVVSDLLHGKLLSFTRSERFAILHSVKSKTDSATSNLDKDKLKGLADEIWMRIFNLELKNGALVGQETSSGNVIDKSVAAYARDAIKNGSVPAPGNELVKKWIDGN